MKKTPPIAVTDIRFVKRSPGWGSVEIKRPTNVWVTNFKTTLNVSVALVFGAAIFSLPVITIFEKTETKIASSHEPAMHAPEVLGATTSENLVEEVETIEEIVPPPDPRISLLESYLAEKKSPMKDHAAQLLEQPQYRLIIGMAFAESRFCRNNILPYNCWGIGGDNPIAYKNYPHAFAEANKWIEKYIADGLDTPKKIQRRWVGHHSDNWILAVEQVIDELTARGL